MTNHPTRSAVAAAKRAGIAAGYSLREGSYSGTTDDVLGTWYVVHRDDDAFRPYGRGYATKSAAWLALADQLVERMRFVADSICSQLVCSAIAWDFAQRPIKSRVSIDDAQVVEVTGCLLTPDEWRTLASFDHTTLADGRRIKVVGVPRECRPHWYSEEVVSLPARSLDWDYAEV